MDCEAVSFALCLFVMYACDKLASSHEVSLYINIVNDSDQYLKHLFLIIYYIYYLQSNLI